MRLAIGGDDCDVADSLVLSLETYGASARAAYGGAAGLVEVETFKPQVILSLLAVEDYLDALHWGSSIGGLEALKARCDENTRVVDEWATHTPWIDYLARDPAIRSNTSVCLTFSEAAAARTPEEQAALAKQMVEMIEKEGAGYDFGAYRAAPAGFRIWCGTELVRGELRQLHFDASMDSMRALIGKHVEQRPVLSAFI